jgi:hypothetical protein
MPPSEVNDSINSVVLISSDSHPSIQSIFEKSPDAF